MALKRITSDWLFLTLHFSRSQTFVSCSRVKDVDTSEVGNGWFTIYQVGVQWMVHISVLRDASVLCCVNCKWKINVNILANREILCHEL